MLRPQTFSFENIHHKYDVASVHFREAGNIQYKERRFFEALENYNKSLMFAPLKSDSMALAYANRSAVYLTVKEYDLCVENIKLARDHGYPKEKFQTLIDREDKCKNLMELHKTNPDNNPWNFFKLSYPANEKIPFIVNCLELVKSEHTGQGVVTNQGGESKISIQTTKIYDNFFFRFEIR